MSFYAMSYVWESAPVASPAEKSVLMSLANRADKDGCNAYPSTPTIAKETFLSPGHVIRVLKELKRRGVIQEGNQAAASHLPANKRPVVYDIQIPASWYSETQLRTINEERAAQGLPPITPENRPPLGPAPERKSRSDKGVPNPKRSPKNRTDRDKSGWGVSETPQRSDAQEGQDSASHVSETPRRGVSETWQDGSRGVSQTPKPVQYLPTVGTRDKPVLKENLSTTSLRSVVGGTASADASPSMTGFPHQDLNPESPDPGPDRPGGDLDGGTGGSPVGGKGRTRRKRTRIPEPFVVADDDLAWAAEKLPGLDVQEATAKFVRYWSGVTGAKGMKADWSLTWRNAMTREFEYLRGRGLLVEPMSAELEDAALRIVAWWWGMFTRGGKPVLEGTEAELRLVVRQALSRGATPKQVQDALKSWRRPVPKLWMIQQAISGGPERQAPSNVLRPSGETDADRRMRALFAGEAPPEDGGGTVTELDKYRDFPGLGPSSAAPRPKPAVDRFAGFPGLDEPTPPRDFFDDDDDAGFPGLRRRA